MTINQHPVAHNGDTPLHEQAYTDLEDVVIDAINSRFDLDDGDADPIAVAAGILEDLFAKYEILPRATVRPEQPPAAVGQVWRGRTGARRMVRIVKLFSYGGKQYIRWEAVSGRGPSSSEVRADLWADRRDFVGEQS